MSMACSTSPHPASGDCPAGLECPTVTVTQNASDSKVSAELAVTSGALYWVDRGWAITDSIVAAPIGGGSPTVFYVAPDTNAAIEAIAVDGQDVYWTEVEASDTGYASTLKAMPQGNGGTPRVLASSPSPSLVFYNLAVDATYAYFSVQAEPFVGGGGLERVPIAGGPAEVVVATDATDPSGAWVDFITAGSTGVYWIEQSPDAYTSLMRLAPGAEQPSILVSASLDGNGVPVSPAGPIAVNGDTVVWIGSDGSVSSAPAAGGTARVLLDGYARATFLAEGESDVFVVGSPPGATAVMQRVPLDGSPATTIASGMGVAGGYSAYQGIVTDATSVYWAGVGGVFSAPQ